MTIVSTTVAFVIPEIPTACTTGEGAAVVVVVVTVPVGVAVAVLVGVVVTVEVDVAVVVAVPVRVVVRVVVLVVVDVGGSVEHESDEADEEELLLDDDEELLLLEDDDEELLEEDEEELLDDDPQLELDNALNEVRFARRRLPPFSRETSLATASLRMDSKSSMSPPPRQRDESAEKRLRSVDVRRISPRLARRVADELRSRAARWWFRRREGSGIFVWRFPSNPRNLWVSSESLSPLLSLEDDPPSSLPLLLDDSSLPLLLDDSSLPLLLDDSSLPLLLDDSLPLPLDEPLPSPPLVDAPPWLSEVDEPLSLLPLDDSKRPLLLLPLLSDSSSSSNWSATSLGSIVCAKYAYVAPVMNEEFFK